jgi:pyruvate/2-oxoglutarate dehydrogenase complex dihydrolipoamide acyltransferase (E2) component
MPLVLRQRIRWHVTRLRDASRRIRMKRLFLSYSREDIAPARALVAAFQQAGFEVFWDQVMPVGVEWAEFLDDKLDQAHCLMVLWTATSVESRWVRGEAYEALQQNKLLPVLLQAVRQPLAFRQIQAFDLTGWSGDASDPRVAHLTQQVHGLPQMQTTQAPSVRASSPSNAAPAPAPAPAPAHAHAHASPAGSAAPALAGWLAGLALLAAGAYVSYRVWPAGLAAEPARPPNAEASGAARVEPSQPHMAPASAATPAPALANGPATSAAPAKASAPAPRPVRPARCAQLLERVQLGETLSEEEQSFSNRRCR